MEKAEKIGGHLHYLATGVASDSEMTERIKKHQHDRNVGPYHWKTVEKSVRIGELATRFNEHDIILLDCVTTLLNNELFLAENPWSGSYLDAVRGNILSGIMAIKNRVSVMIVVSNEVLHEPFSENKLVLSYSRLLGQIHQHLVKEADEAFLVEMGIPIVMKGVRQ